MTLLPVGLLAVLLFPQCGAALRCFHQCNDLSQGNLCSQECEPSQNACQALFRSSVTGTVTYVAFGCTTLDECQNTRCQTEESSIGTHECCCSTDDCNVVPGLGPTIPPLPTPSVPPPSRTEDQLICEVYRVDNLGMVYHNYHQDCQGSCFAAYILNQRNHYALHELGCRNDVVNASTNCSIDSSGSAEFENCSCSGHLCNTISKLQFSDVSSVVEYADAECDALGCEHICVNPRNDAAFCLCRHGFALSPLDPTICVDVNECSNNANLCSDGCRNTEGSYQCTCPAPQILRDDNRTCRTPERLVCDYNTTDRSMVVECPDNEDEAVCTSIFFLNALGELRDPAVSFCDGSTRRPGDPPLDENCILRYIRDLNTLECSCTTSQCNRNPFFPALPVNVTGTDPVTTTEMTSLPQTTSFETTPPDDATTEADAVPVPAAIVGAITAVAVLFIILCFVILALVSWCYCKRTYRRHRLEMQPPLSLDEKDLYPVNGHRLARERLLDPNMISLEDMYFAKGRFGKLQKGTNLSNENFPRIIAVKVFNSDKSWDKEYQIYSQLGHHENIVKCFGKKDPPSCWIMMEYHQCGDLLSVIKRHELTWEQFHSLLLCILRGLNFLHYDDFCPGKKSIAHRDIKPSNILVREGFMNCCISDLGLAITLPTESQCQVGTPRYMAPEIISGAISNSDILSVDMYSFALTMWEMLWRTKPPHLTREEYGGVPPHMAPYAEPELLGNITPDQAIMKDFFKNDLHGTKRPTIPSYFLSHEKYSIFISTMKATWTADARVRLGAATVLKRLEPVDDSGNGSSMQQPYYPHPANPFKTETTTTTTV